MAGVEPAQIRVPSAAKPQEKKCSESTRYHVYEPHPAIDPPLFPSWHTPGT